MIATAVRKLGIAPSHPLNRGLVSHFICLPGEMGGARIRNQVAPHRYASMVTNVTRPTWHSSLGRVGGHGSIKFLFGGTGGGYLDQNYTGVSAYPFTMSCWVNAGGLSDANTRCLMCIGSDTANRACYSINMRGASSTTCRFTIAAAEVTASDETTSTTNYTSPAWHLAVGVFESATSRKLYINGELLSTGTVSVTFHADTASGSTYLGQRNLRGGIFGNAGLNGYADDWRVWNRGLTDTEVQALYNLTRRDSQRTLSMFGPMLHLLVNAASGGSTQDGAISDGAKPGEAFAANVLGTAAVTDGSKGGDTLAGTAVGAAAMADGGVAGDAAAAVATHAGSVSNGAVSGDSESGGNLVLASLSEGSAGSDTWSQIVTINLAWAEGSKAGDTYASSAIALGQIANGGVSGDAASAVATASTSISDGVVASDSLLGGVWTVASWSDGTFASDVWAATILVMSSPIGAVGVARNWKLEGRADAKPLTGVAKNWRLEGRFERTP